VGGDLNPSDVFAAIERGGQCSGCDLRHEFVAIFCSGWGDGIDPVCTWCLPGEYRMSGIVAARFDNAWYVSGSYERYAGATNLDGIIVSDGIDYTAEWIGRWLEEASLRFDGERPSRDDAVARVAALERTRTVFTDRSLAWWQNWRVEASERLGLPLYSPELSRLVPDRRARHPRDVVGWSPPGDWYSLLALWIVEVPELTIDEFWDWIFQMTSGRPDADPDNLDEDDEIIDAAIKRIVDTPRRR